MDGGGRLDQPLMRSGPGPGSGRTEALDAATDELRLAYADRFARVYRRWIGRWGTRLARLPHGVGIAASVLLLAGAVGYGAVIGGHVASVVDWLKDARDQAANAAGFRIAAVSLVGPKEVSREEILTTAGVTGHASLLFLDADAARERLMANPVDRRRGCVQALSGPLADHDHGAAGLCALAAGRARQRHRHRRDRARAVCRGSLSRSAAGGRKRRRAAGQRFPRRR